MSSSGLSVGCLCFLNKTNLARRGDIAKTSIQSLAKLNRDVIVSNNGELTKKELPFEIPINVKFSNLDANYFDIVAHYIPFWHALDKGHNYFAYLYDDFVIYDDALDDAVTFMEKNPQVCALRLPSYASGDIRFNANKTSKVVNPDAVRHDVGAGETVLKNYFADRIGVHDFYFSNWRPNSRPMLWRTDIFKQYFSLDDVERHPIMQAFEKHLYSVADALAKEKKWFSAYLEGGMCHTFPVNTSERTTRSDGFNNHVVDVKKLRECYERLNLKKS